MSRNDSRDIIRLGEKYNVTIIIWDVTGVYVPELNERVNNYKMAIGVEPVVIDNMNNLLKTA